MSIYAAVYRTLEKLDEKNNFETLDDFTDIVRDIHDIVERAVSDFIEDHDDRADMFDDYLPIV